MKFLALLFVSIFVSGILYSESTAAVWSVQKDGSGDFVEIIPAVEAASPGDTILIGPGRFDTFVEYTNHPYWTPDVIVPVDKDNLTFIGSGQGVTFIGPESSSWGYYDDPVGFISMDGGSGSIKNMTIENIETGVYWYQSNLSIENCSFHIERSASIAIAVWINQLLVENCEFEVELNATGVAAWVPTNEVIISNSYFTGQGVGCTLMGTQSAEVTSCIFESISAGVNYEDGTTGTVSNCEFNDLSYGAIVIRDNVDCTASDIMITDCNDGIVVTNGSEFIGTLIDMTNSRVAGFDIGSEGRVVLHDSHIIPESGFAVVINGVFSDLLHQDFSGNYWGTTDPDEVAAMIWDFNDDQTMNSIVDFLPMAEGTVATDETTLDGLKAMYRR